MILISAKNISDNDNSLIQHVETLMRHLYVSVMSKKNKNVDVLQLASEVNILYILYSSHHDFFHFFCACSPYCKC